MMLIVRKYQVFVLDTLEENKRQQIILMGVMMPIFLLHTYFGGHAFFNASTAKHECRQEYDGEVFYIIIFMFAISMCFVFVLLLTCVLLPTWIKQWRQKRRRARFEQRFPHLVNEIEDPVNPNQQLLLDDPELDEPDTEQI
eukprot:CAMPEP_0170492742 /NCGR_PEP_ID=MMETSP0208-20121228/12753_1 /TAXON_ID=197538 /ORGANISM="Strombidium inclinatum, Strain S3" /LENGTH=140 /DNA_ID=CAMNT_0010768533 /DNA_START=169 /DNA_END=591 /DNA_ORIENTATION=+